MKSAKDSEKQWSVPDQWSVVSGQCRTIGQSRDNGEWSVDVQSPLVGSMSLGRQTQATRQRVVAGTATSVGILVHGDNHFIVRGPEPTWLEALALVKHWSLIQIGRPAPPELQGWRISSREFRENLEWAIIVPDDSEMTSAVNQLLGELSARGVPIRRGA